MSHKYMNNLIKEQEMTFCDNAIPMGGNHSINLQSLIHFPPTKTGLQPGQASNLTWSMVFRHTHVESATSVAQVLGGQDGALLADEQRGAVGVAADVVGADGQVGDLEVLDAVHVEALVENTVLDDAVALLWCHGASAYLRLVHWQ